MSGARIDQHQILAIASRLHVLCGGCGQQARPFRVLGVVVKPQFDTAPHADVEYRCETPDCDSPIHVEIDVV